MGIVLNSYSAGQNVKISLRYFYVYIMKISGLCFILWVVAVNAIEVFRYDDKETSQSHFMEGDPGTSVTGGWEFRAPEGDNYELNYVADVNGFQPQAGYLPVH